MTTQLGVRVALIGFTGTGKSTIAAALLTHLSHPDRPARLVKLAAPLYRLQHSYYREAGITLPSGTQDQELLAEIATQLRRISPHALLSPFLAAVADASPATAIINDDLRVPDPDAAGLRAAGFCVIRLECPDDVRRDRLAGRGDRTVLDEPAIFGPLLSQIPTDLTLTTHPTTPTETVHRVLDHLRTRHPQALEVTGIA